MDEGWYLGDAGLRDEFNIAELDRNDWLLDKEDWLLERDIWSDVAGLGGFAWEWLPLVCRDDEFKTVLNEDGACMKYELCRGEELGCIIVELCKLEVVVIL